MDIHNPHALPPGGLLATPPDPLCGQVIHFGERSYVIHDPIGEGAFGRVYACTDRWDNELAVKVLHAGGGDTSAAALREFENLLALRHPKITHVYDAFEWGGRYFLVTERCGATLRSLFNTPGIEPRLWIVPVARCVLQAVDSIHRWGMVHKDLHPGNLFLKWQPDEMAPDQHPRVIDFKVGDLGIANVASLIDPAGSTFAQWMLAPECIDPASFGPVDHRVDIYHLGLLILSMWYGRELRFSREDMITGVPRRMAEALPAPFNDAVGKALRRRALFRTASAAEFWCDLRAASG